MNTVYHIGYNTSGAAQLLVDLMRDPAMMLVDTRLSPNSLKRNWRWESLEKHFGYGTGYVKAGAILGNRNHNQKGAPIDIVDMDNGLAFLGDLLNAGRDLILLCGCSDGYCHRYNILSELQRVRSGVTVVHPEYPLRDRYKRVFSIRQPYSDWILRAKEFVKLGIPPKCTENRKRRPGLHDMGTVLIHAGQRFDYDAMYWFDKFPSLRELNRPMNEYPLGAILGVADLVDVVDSSSDPWFLGEYGLVFANPRMFKTPIYCAGELGFFDVPWGVMDQVDAAMAVLDEDIIYPDLASAQAALDAGEEVRIELGALDISPDLVRQARLIQDKAGLAEWLAIEDKETEASNNARIQLRNTRGLPGSIGSETDALWGD